MKTTKLYFFALLLFFLQDCSSPTFNIFPKQYRSEFFPLKDEKRFTPSIEEVDLAEEIVKNKLKGLNVEMLNQGGSCPIIHKKLNRYDRQYFGYFDNTGKKVIWINMIWKNSIPIKDMGNEVIIVFDGCSYHWSISVNLEERLAFDLAINGSA